MGVTKTSTFTMLYVQVAKNKVASFTYNLVGLASALVNKKRFVIGGIWRFEFQTTLMVKIDSS